MYKLVGQSPTTYSIYCTYNYNISNWSCARKNRAISWTLVHYLVCLVLQQDKRAG